MGDIRIQKAVLHILDTNVGVPVLSQRELAVDGETEDFLENMVTKLVEDDNLKPAFFGDGPSVIRDLLYGFQADQNFLALSQAVANALYHMMLTHVDISPADLVCCLFSEADRNCFGVCKLNYRTNYIHYIEYDEAQQNVNSLIKQKTVLPAESAKLEECFVVDLTDFSLRLIEKQYEINGAKEFYLSKILLACQDELSNNDKAKVLDKVTQKMSKKFSDDQFGPMARLRKAVSEDLDEGGAINLEHVAREVFGDDPGAQKEYLDEMYRAGLQEKEIELPAKIANRKFRNQKIQTDTGIEINFPADYYNNKEKIEFITNVDGTILIVIKNVGKIINK